MIFLFLFMLFFIVVVGGGIVAGMIEVSRKQKIEKQLLSSNK